ncbi:MAG: SdrD B-like domain-containing protein [Pseudomonadota bacterium]
MTGSTGHLIGRAGVVEIGQDHANQWHTIGFGTDANGNPLMIHNAVVVLMVNTASGSQPVTVRADHVTSHGFQFQLDEWDYLDGAHAVESVSWLAVSEGVHTLSDGTVIVAENIIATDNFQDFAFDQSFGAAPIVLAQTVTTNDGDAVTTRIDDVSGSGFRLKLQGEEADRAHDDEIVAVIAIQGGTDTVVGNTGDVVRHNDHHIDFGTSVDGEVAFFAQMQTTDGGDTATVRGVEVDATGATVFVEEEQSANSETRHTTEEVGFFALTAGDLLASVTEQLTTAQPPEPDPVVTEPPAAVVENLGPTAANNAYTIDELGSIGPSGIFAANVIIDADPASGAIDSDPENDPISVTSVRVDGIDYTPGQAFPMTLTGVDGLSITGTATVAADGSLIFVPDPGAAETLFSGDQLSGSFDYTIIAGDGSAQRIIDFEQFAGGTFLDGLTLPGIAAITSTRRQDLNDADAPNVSRLYDSRLPGRDNDLQAGVGGVLSNVLIIQEDNGSNTDPDDNAQGGTMRFDFTGPTTVYQVDLIDTEENNNSQPAWVFEFADGSTQTIAATITGDTDATTQVFGSGAGLQNVVAMTLEVIGSAGIDNLVISSPATSTASVTITVDGLGEVPPPIVIEAQNDSYGILESEDLTGANIVEGDLLARTIGELGFTGGLADGTNPSALSVIAYSVPADTDGDGFAATLSETPVVGQPVTVTLTNGTDTYSGELTLSTDGTLSFTTLDFEALGAGETVTFSLNYIVSEGAPAAASAPRAVDFDGLLTGPAPDGGGVLVDTQLAGEGLAMVRAWRHGENPDAAGFQNRAMIFNSDPSFTTGGDPDLEVGEGAVVIISEDLDQSDPDDQAGGGFIEFAFDGPKSVESLLLVDTEEPAPVVTLTYADGSTTIVRGPVTSDGGKATLLFADAFTNGLLISSDGPPSLYGVVKVTVELAGSGAVDMLSFSGDLPPLLTEATATITIVGEADAAPTGTISGIAFEDADGDGQRDADEALKAGVTVELFDTSGTLVDTTVTDETGAYSFDALGDGDYTVDFGEPAPQTEEFTLQDQGDDASDSDVDAAGRDAVTITMGSDATVDAGYTSGSIGDFVFFDLDGDGLQGEADSAAAGLEVELFRLDGAEFVSTGRTAITGADGLYGFAGLTSGTYRVQVNQSEFAYTAQGSDATAGDDSDVDASGLSRDIALGVGEQRTDIDAGLLASAITGTVFEDFTGAVGKLDDIDQTVQGAEVQLSSAADPSTAVATTITDEAGNYSFSGLVADTYEVRVTNPQSGTQFTLQDVDGNLSDDIDSDVDQEGRVTVTLAAGETAEDVDAGITQSLIGDFVFIDENANGLRDLRADGMLEIGLGGVAIDLYAVAADGAETLIGSTLTSSGDVNTPEGFYTFDGLTAGDYRIQVAGQAGYMFSPADQVDANPGTIDDEIDSDVDATGSAAVSLTVGEVNPNIDVGLVPDDPLSGVIGDQVWLDANGDGIQDLGSGETGLNDVAVMLYRLEGGARTLVGTTMTAAGMAEDGSVQDGLYRFENLPFGTYELEFTAPAGFEFTQGNAAAATDLNDSDVPLAAGAGSVGTVTGITLDRGEVDLTWDAGLVETAESSIGDRIWFDIDRDGIQDAGEQGAAGFTVELFEADLSGAFVATGMTAVTDGDGLYSFDGLTDGTYRIQVVSQPGFDFTLQSQGSDTVADSDVDATGLSGDIVLGIAEARTDIDAGLVTNQIQISGEAIGQQAESQAIAVIIDVSAKATNTEGFGTADNNGSGAIGTEVDAALESLADLAIQLTSEGRGDQEIVVFTNSRDTGDPTRNRVIETDTGGAPLTAATIAAAAIDLGASGLFANVFDTPAGFSDTMSVGEALADAAAYLDAAGKDTNQTILMTASTGYSETLNNNQPEFGDTAGDKVVEGRLGIVAEPGMGTQFGAITPGLFEFQVSGDVDNVVELSGRRDAVKLEGAFFHREPVDLSGVLNANAGAGQTLEIGTILANGFGDIIDADTGAAVFPGVDFNQLAFNQRAITVTFFDQTNGIMEINTPDFGTEIWVLNNALSTAEIQAVVGSLPYKTVDPSLIYEPGDGATFTTAFLFDPTDYPSLTSATIDPAALSGGSSVTEVVLPGAGGTGTDQFEINGTATDLDIVFVDSLDNNQDILIIDGSLFFEKGAILDELQPDGVQVFDMAPFGLRDLIADGDPGVIDAGPILDFTVRATDASGTGVADLIDISDPSVTVGPEGLSLAATALTVPSGATGLEVEIGVDRDGSGAIDQADEVVTRSFDLTSGDVQFQFSEDLLA